MSALYEKDFHQWSQDQASLIKNKSFYKLDIENLVEEIESLSASDKHALESHLAILTAHLLKVKYQPEKYTRSWDLSIKNAKRCSNKILRKNPSLKHLLSEFLSDAFFTARLEAAIQTGLDEGTFPEQCPWTIEELLNEEKNYDAL